MREELKVASSFQAFKNLWEELVKDGAILAFSGLSKEVREAIAAALGDKFKYLTSNKECDDFIGKYPAYTPRFDQSSSTFRGGDACTLARVVSLIVHD